MNAAICLDMHLHEMRGCRREGMYTYSSFDGTQWNVVTGKFRAEKKLIRQLLSGDKVSFIRTIVFELC